MSNLEESDFVLIPNEEKLSNINRDRKNSFLNIEENDDDLA